ncbi:MAG TPA: pyridoxamine 5'-phosphate oxidase family protein [Pseudonocardiaceae bacterium]|nr:pyridoxamine 5'-phosphate oxidase family protein [Pseudonocardiaceae bacterium]
MRGQAGSYIVGKDESALVVDLADGSWLTVESTPLRFTDRTAPPRTVGPRWHAAVMTSWQQFEQEAPELAREIRSRFEAHESHVLATLRKDGSPRVSGSEVAFQGENLTFGSMLNAVKARDLQRDGRFAVHAYPSTDTGDAKIAGVATEVKEAPPAGEEPVEESHAFVADLTEAVLTSVDQEAQELVIQVWRPGQGVKTIRRK